MNIKDRTAEEIVALALASRDRGKVLAKERRAKTCERWKNRARSKCRYAVKTGKISRMPCAVCQSVRSEAHHTDYSKPLDVVWLCSRHHKAAHARERKA